MNLLPTLRGTLVALRPLEPTDLPILFKRASDPLIWELHPEPDRWKPEIFQRFLERESECGLLVAIDTASEAVIGSTRYYAYDPVEPSVFIGYTFLARAFWGGRHNSEMKQLMLEHAFKTVSTVRFHVGASNWRSQRAVQKLGARELARLEGPPPEIIYGITKNEFNNPSTI